MSNEHQLKLGMIGLDTSHVQAFTNLLNDSAHKYHVPGGKVTVAYPGGSPDFGRSISRVQEFTALLHNEYGVEIVDSPSAVAERCDAILLESADGRVHLSQFEQVAHYGKRVFIDKPFAVSTADAVQIAKVAAQHGTPVMSCSALRFAQGLTETLQELASNDEEIFGVDCYGPLTLEPTQPGLFWYGIHTVEMLYRIFGQGCLHVQAQTTEDHDLITGVWSDGRIGTIRGNRKGNNRFGVLIHTNKQTKWVDIKAYEKPFYASLLEQVLAFFQTGTSPIAMQETIEIIHFIQSANASRSSAQVVQVKQL